MNKETPYRDQAERLRKKIDRPKLAEDENSGTLPPRSEVHQQKVPKTKLKLKYPVIRLLVLFFILLPLTIFSIYSYLDADTGNSALDSITGERKGFEMVNLIEKTAPPVDKEEQKVNDTAETGGNRAEPVIAPLADNSEEGNKNTPSSSVSTGEAVKAPAAVREPSREQQQPEIDETEGEPAEPLADDQVVYHTVQAKETLYRVAMKYYKSQEGIEIIKQANSIKDNEIWVGQVLTIPL